MKDAGDGWDGLALSLSLSLSLSLCLEIPRIEVRLRSRSTASVLVVVVCAVVVGHSRHGGEASGIPTGTAPATLRQLFLFFVYGA